MKDTVLTFKRYEKKYVLQKEQYRIFMDIAGEHLVPDEYHKSLVCSIYYDSDSYSLIRHSIDGPVYKEKIRLRSYGVPETTGTAFVELKKKYKGVVYKRRIQTDPATAEAWLAGRAAAPEESQTSREIDWFLKTNPVVPKAFIGSDRLSWVDREEPELRFTFDESIRWRTDKLSLMEGDSGEELLKDGSVLMEIKIPEAAPLWLARLLSDEEIFPTGFSKYGNCYKENILKKTAFAD